jgi:hypothetical protein
MTVRPKKKFAESRDEDVENVVPLALTDAPADAPTGAPADKGADDAPQSPGDVFDRLESFRLRQTFDRVRTRKPLSTVGIRTPKKHEWFTAHTEYRYEGVLFEEQSEGISKEWFFPTNDEVLAELESLSISGLKNVAIFWWINRKKNTFIWPVVMLDSDGRQNDWHASMYEMMSTWAKGQWCRIEAGDSGYHPTLVDESEDEPPPDPEWPLTKGFGEVLRVAFKKGGRVVDNLEHPLFKRLRRG